MRIDVRRAMALALVLAGCGGSTSDAVRKTRPFAPAEYRLGVEDVVEVAVWKEPELSVTAPVRPDGKLTVPVAGEIVAAGRTAHELEQEIVHKLSVRIAAPVVTVVVKEVNASRVFVLGEVTKPGAYPLRGAMTVVQALALAGGMTEFAKRSDIVILRPTSTGAQERLQLDYEDAVKSAAIMLSPGDTVVVP
jgi:polysaccharide biosynthesis/export protein